MSSSKIHKLMKILKANRGCGCRSRTTDIIQPKPKSATLLSDKNSGHCPSSTESSSHHGGGKSAADDEDCTSTTFSLNIDASPHFCLDHTKFSDTVSPCGKIQDSFAVVKDSDDPYQDFRRSMLQMIFEKELYSKSDLQQLLDCLLQLNSPHHHDVIVQAFIEIWNGGVPAASDSGEAMETPP